MTLRKSLLVLCVLASTMVLAGCLYSRQAFFGESPDVVVPDISGTYTSKETGNLVTVSRKGGNAFLVKNGDDEPEEAVLVPLELPGTYLLQIRNDEEYTLAAIQVGDTTIRVGMFASAAQDVMSSALNDEDGFRRLAADVLTQRLEALYKKHGLEVDDELYIVNRPATDALVSFFSDCLKEHGTLMDGEVLTKKAPQE